MTQNTFMQICFYVCISKHKKLLLFHWRPSYHNIPIWKISQNPDIVYMQWFITDELLHILKWLASSSVHCVEKKWLNYHPRTTA